MCPLSASSPESLLLYYAMLRTTSRFDNALHCLMFGRSPYAVSCHSASVCASTASASCQYPTHGSLATRQQYNLYFFFLRKEVIQPHLPIRLPCYDFTPVIMPAFGSSLLKGWVTDFGHSQLPWCDGRCVQDPGTYSPRRSDSRLLAIPASCSRVADYNPN